MVLLIHIVLPAKSDSPRHRIGIQRWNACKGVEARSVGPNLFNSRHPEFGDVEQAIATNVDRSVLGKIVWSF